MTNRAKLSNRFTQNWICEGCRRRVITERATGVHNIVSKTATISSGLDVNNCGRHIGDMVWPLIRLNLKFQTVDDVQDQGLGYLFLEAPASPCESIYSAISDQIVWLSSISNSKEEDICVENLLIGTRDMNYMPSSPNSFFIPYNIFERDMRTIRFMFWKNYGITINERTNQPINPIDTILIMLKMKHVGKLQSLNYHNFGNIPQITNMIHNEFSYYLLSIVSWEHYSMRHQVHIISHVKLTISLTGSANMNAFLFQDNSTLFSYCQKGEDSPNIVDSSTYFLDNGIKMQRSNEVKLWFQEFDYGLYYEFCENGDMILNGQDTIVNVTKLRE